MFVSSSVFCLLIVSCLARPYFLYVGAGGCDSDDPSCKQPQDISTISIFAFESTTGNLSYLSNITGLAPIWLRLHPYGNYLYTVSPNGVSCYSVNHRNGELFYINSLKTPGPVVFMDIDGRGRFLYVASYSGGSIASALLHNDGTIGEIVSTRQFYGHGVNPARQEAPHPHSINAGLRDDFVFVPDLGLDIVFSFYVNTDGQFVNTSDTNVTRLPPGSGPRHMGFHPTVDVVYVLSEMASTISVFHLEVTLGWMHMPPLQVVSTLPADFKGFSKAAEVIVHRSGKWLLASNRGYTSPSNSITVFRIGDDTLLEESGRYPIEGTFPRGMVITPDDTLIVGGQDTNSITTFSFDPVSGHLTLLSTFTSLPNVVTPVTFAFVEQV